MSHITDGLLQRLFDEIGLGTGRRILDLGSGRGFLARWLQWKRISVEYVGVDFSASAVNAARKNAPGWTFVLADFLQPLGLGEFDVVCAIESTGDGYVTDDLATAIVRSLKPDGVGLATIVTLQHSFEEIKQRSRRALEQAGARIEILDVTSAASQRAKQFSESVLLDNSLPSGIREKARHECEMFLEQIRLNAYGYGIVKILKPVSHC